jgi:hypothetical protein
MEPPQSGGEGGIRTRGAFRHTRSPGARIRPDYATSPSVADYTIRRRAWQEPRQVQPKVRLSRIEGEINRRENYRCVKRWVG